MKKQHLFTTLLLAFASLVITQNSCADATNQTVSDNPTYNGIDISHHQKEVDWESVSKNKNIEYVYIKASEGKTYTDPNYKKNIEEAKKNNIKFGAYHYYRTTSTVKEQYDHFTKLYPKDSAVLRPMIDVENCGKLTKSEIQKNIRELSHLMEKHYGCKPLIYSVNTTYNKYLAPEFNDHILYIGRYGGEKPTIKGGTKETKIIWQYSESGKIKGIKTNVDFSLFWKNVSLDELLIK